MFFIGPRFDCTFPVKNSSKIKPFNILECVLVSGSRALRVLFAQWGCNSELWDWKYSSAINCDWREREPSNHMGYKGFT